MLAGFGIRVIEQPVAFFPLPGLIIYLQVVHSIYQTIIISTSSPFLRRPQLYRTALQFQSPQYIGSTMNKKPLQKLTGNSSFNQDVFAAARTIVTNCQQLLAKTDALSPEEKPALKDKQQLLQNAIKNAINSFGKFVSLQKPPLATVVDHGLNIFEAITDNIETAVQRYRQAHKNSKSKEERVAKQPCQPKRPQDLHPYIKPASFDFHNHEKNLEFIRTELSLTKSKPLDDEASYVSTPAQLQAMVDQLSRQSQIAVDVEHSSKSYQGMTCLIQVSTRSRDYIIDVFPIWREMPLLKKVMENESIIKVMHGAEMDTRWLQRDFNIHILNLFDTHRASRVLGFPRLSYAYLLNYYCNVTTDKTYQLADWRQRPLTHEMLHYARLDTHYLLEIFDRLLADLHQKALTMSLDPHEVITNVYAASYEVSKTEAQLFDFRQKEFFQRLKKQTKEKEFAIFDKVFDVLDRVAKNEDVSFDELVNHKMERQVISKIKEMLYLKNNDNAKVKIDKFLTIFKESHQSSYFQSYLSEIKTELQSFFSTFQEAEEKPAKKPKKSIIAHLEEYHPTQETTHKKATIFKEFKEFPERTYECLNVNPFSMLLFEPVMAFLSKKHGLTQKEEKEEQMQAEESEEQSVEQLQGQANVEKQQEQEQAGVIEFKRINPNVVYTIEQAAVVEEKHKPRKKRKQLDYETKLKSKEANIFELLDD